VGAAFGANQKRVAHKKANAPANFEAKLQDFKDDGLIIAKGADRLPRELRRSWLTMVAKLGNGNFGEVWKGMLDDKSAIGHPEYMVAAKIVLDVEGVEDEAAFAAAETDLLKEALLMAQVDTHRNLVSIVGVITRGQPKVLVISYCEHGELQKELKKRAANGVPVDPATKLRFCAEVADGMGHLAQHHFVHRDLAARNVLLSSGMVCKVADFGLSRRVQTEENAGDCELRPRVSAQPTA
jgi:serine/threonine protein kinase